MDTALKASLSSVLSSLPLAASWVFERSHAYSTGGQLNRWLRWHECPKDARASLKTYICRNRGDSSWGSMWGGSACRTCGRTGGWLASRASGGRWSRRAPFVAVSSVRLARMLGWRSSSRRVHLLFGRCCRPLLHQSRSLSGMIAYPMQYALAYIPYCWPRGSSVIHSWETFCCSPIAPVSHSAVEGLSRRMRSYRGSASARELSLHLSAFAFDLAWWNKELLFDWQRLGRFSLSRLPQGRSWPSAASRPPFSFGRCLRGSLVAIERAFAPQRAESRGLLLDPVPAQGSLRFLLCCWGSFMWRNLLPGLLLSKRLGSDITGMTQKRNQTRFELGPWPPCCASWYFWPTRGWDRRPACLPLVFGVPILGCVMWNGWFYCFC